MLKVISKVSFSQRDVLSSQTVLTWGLNQTNGPDPHLHRNYAGENQTS